MSCGHNQTWWPRDCVSNSRARQGVCLGHNQIWQSNRYNWDRSWTCHPPHPHPDPHPHPHPSPHPHHHRHRLHHQIRSDHNCKQLYIIIHYSSIFIIFLYSLLTIKHLNYLDHEMLLNSVNYCRFLRNCEPKTEEFNESSNREVKLFNHYERTATVVESYEQRKPFLWTCGRTCHRPCEPFGGCHAPIFGDDP